jgi:hypothetical protein
VYCFRVLLIWRILVIFSLINIDRVFSSNSALSFKLFNSFYLNGICMQVKCFWYSTCPGHS